MWEKVEEAPCYGDDHTPLELESVEVVLRGTAGGNPTVDLILTDESGRKYVSLTFGSHLVALGKVLSPHMNDKAESVGLAALQSEEQN